MGQNNEHYPTEIIPFPEYRREMDINKLLAAYCNLLAVRLVDGCPEEPFVIKTECGDTEITTNVFKNSMMNLSMNLSGGLFDTDPMAHLRFLPKNESASQSWDGKSVSPELYTAEDSYIVHEPCFGICFFVRDIHNRTFPFYKHFESQEDRDKYEADVEKAVTEEERAYDSNFVAAFVSKKENVEVRARIKVHHVATMVNYWHLTLDTYRPTDKVHVYPNEKLKNADRMMFKALKQDLVRYCLINAHPDYQIDSAYYIE